MKNIREIRIAIITLTPGFIIAAIGSVITVTRLPNWYASLIKPSFGPPDWLFGPVWTLLYFMMGVSFYLICKDWSGDKKQKNAVRVYIFQLVLNLLWSIIFFGFNMPLAAFLEIIVLWFLILANIIVFWRINKIAGVLLIPYIFWVTFASVLNLAIYYLN